MSAEFVSARAWRQLTKAARASRQPCAVAVAYFAKGASRLLPLPKGSRLVVNASEGAVKSGQTCPKDLLAMTKRGVRVYSVANLHAKVFVLGRETFVGSTNVSNPSATRLIEAFIRTTERATVSAARKFVSKYCLHEQTPEQLKRLARMYRPPKVPGGGGRRKRLNSKASPQPELPRLQLAQLVREDNWSNRDQALHDEGTIVAKERREHPRSFKLGSFRWTGHCSFRQGDVVIQITDEGAAGRFMDAPGNVLYVRTRRDKSRQVSFVYVEHPAKRRRQIKAVAKRLGHGALKNLQRRGLVQGAEFREALLGLWSD